MAGRNLLANRANFRAPATAQTPQAISTQRKSWECSTEDPAINALYSTRFWAWLRRFGVVRQLKKD